MSSDSRPVPPETTMDYTETPSTNPTSLPSLMPHPQASTVQPLASTTTSTTVVSGPAIVNRLSEPTTSLPSLPSSLAPPPSQLPNMQQVITGTDGYYPLASAGNASARMEGNVVASMVKMEKTASSGPLTTPSVPSAQPATTLAVAPPVQSVAMSSAQPATMPPIQSSAAPLAQPAKTRPTREAAQRVTYNYDHMPMYAEEASPRPVNGHAPTSTATFPVDDSGKKGHCLPCKRPVIHRLG